MGRIAEADGTIRLRPRRVHLADVGFHPNARVPGSVMTSGPIPDVTPDVAVEVVSVRNTDREMELKRGGRFASGTRLVWQIDLRARVINVHTGVTAFVRLTEADTRTGDSVLPGFSAPVAEMFDLA